MRFYKGSKRLFDSVEIESTTSTSIRRVIQIKGITSSTDLIGSEIKVLSLSNANSDEEDIEFVIINDANNTIHTQTISLPENWILKNRIYNIYFVDADNMIVYGGSIGSSNNSSLPVGSGMDYYGTVAPENYMFADGTAISRTTYAELFKVIGTTYGTGDGSTTFNLPDKRSRVSVMTDTSSTYFKSAGTKGGEAVHTLTTAEIPSHSHTATDAGHTHTVTDPGHSHPYSDLTITLKNEYDRTFDGYGADNTSSMSKSTSTAKTGVTIASGKASISVSNTGSSSSHNNLQPYLVCNYIIKVK